MNHISLTFISALIVVTSGCSGSSESTSSRVKKPLTQTGDCTGNGPTVGSLTNLSCNDQWALAVKQQPLGQKFAYAGTIKLPSLSGITVGYTRSEEVTASSDAAISRKISVTADPAVSSFFDAQSLLQKLGTNQLTLTKEKFIQTCSKANGQPVAVTGLGGELVIGAFKDEMVSLKSGQTIATKHVDIDVKNVSLGNYSVTSARVGSNISAQYPVLPLKQQLILSDISEAFLKGATLDELLATGLPN